MIEVIEVTSPDAPPFDGRPLPDVDVRIGMAVECYVVKVEDELGVPFWRPVSEPSGR